MHDADIEIDRHALAILTHLRNRGYEAYFVGGCVRDLLLGKRPKDWDIATSAVPEEVEALFPHTVPVGKAFGVVLVVENGRNCEVATFRTECGYRDGRRPDAVEFASAVEDVKRRDFTINALLYDPVQEEVLDFVGGRRDLENQVIRTVGDPAARFQEDHLRLLRAVRFAGRTGFVIEQDTAEAMRRMAALVQTVSGERTGQELTIILTEGYAAYGIQLMRDTELLPHLLPEIAAMDGVPQPPRFHPEGDVYQHTLLMLGGLDETIQKNLADKHDTAPCNKSIAGQPGFAEDDGAVWRLQLPTPESREMLAWAVLLHDVGKPETLTHADRIRFNCHDRLGSKMTVGILQRLRRPKRVIDAATELVGGHMKFAALKKMRTAKRRRLLQNPLFPLHLELHRLDCVGSHGNLSLFEYALQEWLQEQAAPPPPEPIVSGRDLIACGYQPGPRMGQILRAVEDARLEGQVSSKDDALAWVEERFPEKGRTVD